MGNTGLERISFNNDSRFGNSNKSTKKLPLAAVDQLVDELVAEYQNDGYKKWYFKVVYEFGFEKVHEWRRRASEGAEPSKLFTTYVNQARRFRRNSDDIQAEESTK